jgi:ribosomal protein L18
VLDPITGHMGKADSFKDAEVRSVLTPLAALAHKHTCSVFGLAHLNKAQQQAVAYRIGGSIAFRAVARAVFYVASEKDQDGTPTGRNVLYHDKGNLAVLKDPRGYSIMEKDGCGVVAWDRQPVADHLTDALGGMKTETRSAKVDRAETWLRERLAAAPVPSKQVEAEARAAGIGERALEQAKKALRIRFDRDKFGKGSTVSWVLPAPADGGRA